MTSLVVPQSLRIAMKIFIEPTCEITVIAKTKPNDFHLRDLMIYSMKPENLVTALLHCFLKGKTLQSSSQRMTTPVAPLGLVHNCCPSWCRHSRQGKSARVEDRQAGRLAEPEMQKAHALPKKNGQKLDKNILSGFDTLASDV